MVLAAGAHTVGSLGWRVMALINLLQIRRRLLFIQTTSPFATSLLSSSSSSFGKMWWREGNLVVVVGWRLAAHFPGLSTSGDLVELTDVC